MSKIQATITPYLWFNNQAKEAAEFYVSIFENSKILSSSQMVTEFELERQKFIGLNGGPAFPFTEAVSFLISVETQEEVDYFWNKLTEGGSESQCGWLKDKYGLSWQVVPKILSQLLTDPNPRKADSVMQAMLKMSKIEIYQLQEAYSRV